MSRNSLATIGLVGHGVLANLLAQKLAAFFKVVSWNSQGERVAGELTETVDDLGALAARADVVLLAEGAMPDESLMTTMGPGHTLVDLMPGDPDVARTRARWLAEAGMGLVDAPLQFDHLAQFPEAAAFLCGGASSDLAKVMPVLEKTGASIIACGETGSGKTAQSIVAAVAICNRLISYECAAVGVANGLALADIGSVLNRCSGANSATERVLPAIAENRASSDKNLRSAATELGACMNLARQFGAPALMANQVANQVLSASRSLAADATLDDLRSLVEKGSNLCLAATTSGATHA
jgi:3-hydroxyisobutyrate dehydrogenase